MTRTVVAGVDGSPEGLAAADWAAREALRRGLPLRLVHAWEGGLPADIAPDAVLPELRAPQYRAMRVLRSVLDQLVERYPQLSVSAEEVCRPPVSTLLAESENADLLVIGSQGPSGLGGFMSGSVAMATVARLQHAVVLVREGETAEAEHLPGVDGKPSIRMPCRDVAVAVGLDEPSHDVLDFAFHAADLRRAPLRAVHAWRVPVSHGLPDAEARARIRGVAERELAALLAPWREKYPTAVVEELHEGWPAHVLVRAASGAGLVVAGSRGRRTAFGPHTGPVVHALIHHVHCPVALVPHDSKGRPSMR
ncbi:stress-inducible protein [Streptomyces viridochromogenes DSM 40736]|uniref:Stress-inducible protein n=1 Tax=Streptomyces viridochromogenes (strain DSM 40736 / JCM 4977 / BCRC 1201 / Tue 494) TaxID=591159 RepID=D9X7L2_STRVT|nr:universal stress protein [Streptomyces viridochromogenes]EFL29908.1 stress-inducible protein [Streptomyces viridochromogenes DSM 40736]